MYKIERKDYGFKLTFAGNMSKDEMSKWVEESKVVLTGQMGSFGVFVDMRTLGLLADDAKAEMMNGQKLYKASGMQRSVVILESAILAMQFKNIAKQTGIYQWERYIAAQADPNWEATGIAWLKSGVDPDLQKAA